MIPRKRTESGTPQALNEFGAQFQIPEIQRIAPYGKGSINETFLVQTSGSPFILQQLRPAYDYGSLEDYEAITQCVDRAGIITPRIVPTKTGSLGAVRDNRLWRMTSFVPGVMLERSPTSSQAQSAAALLGRWHERLSTLDYDFHFKLPDFHDTPKKMIALQAALQRYEGTEKYEQLALLAEEVLTAYASLGATTLHLPRRITHGDPNIHNVRFTNDGNKAVSLLDLDTLGRNSVVIDIAEAVRCWAQIKDMQAPHDTRFDSARFQRILKGYRSTAHFLTPDELYAIPDGVEQVTLELTARYITDAFEERYFRHYPMLYQNLFEQNKVDALIQLNFYRSFVAQRAGVEGMIMKH